MSGREELAKTLEGTIHLSSWAMIADALIADGWVKPRRVTTAEELDALPVGSVVLDLGNTPWQKTDVDFWESLERYNDNWSLAEHYAPLTVLHEGIGE